MRTVIPRSARLSVGVVLVAVGLVGAVRAVDPAGNAVSAGVPSGFDKVIEDNANRMVREGRQTFRFDTFGDEAFWGDALQLHRAIAGEKNGGVGGGVSPKTALSVGLKVDADSLPPELVAQIKAGKVDLDDSATTLALLKLNAVVGLTGRFDNAGRIQSIGIRPGGREPAHLDRLRLGALLERLRRRNRNARLGHFLRPALRQQGAVPGVGEKRRGQYARFTRPHHLEAGGASFLSARHSCAE